MPQIDITAKAIARIFSFLDSCIFR